MPVVLDLEHLCFDECDLKDVEDRHKERHRIQSEILRETGHLMVGRRLQKFLQHSETTKIRSGLKAPVERKEAVPVSGTVEARVREMTSARAIEVCKANNIAFKTEAPNPGVLGMRAKNALYVAIRRGVELKI
jgi:hypothetical protein